MASIPHPERDVAAMPVVYRLDNVVQGYDWGSRSDIQSLLGDSESDGPQAELWLGAHPSAASLTQPWPASSGEKTRLNDLIQQAPVEMLGNRVLDLFGPRLPYLLKVLAADRALSLQVHPAPHSARAGFNRENREQIPLTAKHRSFHDANHKPEMIVAITEFHALAGLRAPRVILKMLKGLPGPLFEIIRSAITVSPNATGLKNALTNLLSQRDNPVLGEQLSDAILAIQHRITVNPEHTMADQTVIELAAQHPGDVGALSSYLLNRVTLQPGEALFLDDGEAHAYLKGLGVEVMANSDNVLRAGLTSKHIDLTALLECMSFHPKIPFRPAPNQSGKQSIAITYRPPVSEFALTMLTMNNSETLSITQGGPRILLVLEGEVNLTYGLALSAKPTTVRLTRGSSVFIPDAVGVCEISGSGQAVCAWVP